MREYSAPLKTHKCALSGVLFVCSSKADSSKERLGNGRKEMRKFCDFALDESGILCEKKNV